MRHKKVMFSFFSPLNLKGNLCYYDLCSWVGLQCHSSWRKHFWRQVVRVSILGGEENPKEDRNNDKEHKNTFNGEEVRTNVQDGGKETIHWDVKDNSLIGKFWFTLLCWYVMLVCCKVRSSQTYRRLVVMIQTIYNLKKVQQNFRQG